MSSDDNNSLGPKSDLPPFPMPPGTNRSATLQTAPEQPKAYNPRLVDDEIMFILKAHLQPHQMLNDQLIEFILAYLECRNVAQAARAAGMPNSAGHYWRSKPNIHAAIEAIAQKAVLKFGYDVSDTVERVKEISDIDPIEFENPDGSFKTHMSQIRPEARRAIKKFKAKNIFGEDPNGMKTVIGVLIEVELHDKMEAHRLLAREKGTFKETKKIEHDVTGNMKDVLLGSVERAEARALEAARPVLEIEGRDESEQK